MSERRQIIVNCAKLPIIVEIRPDDDFDEYWVRNESVFLCTPTMYLYWSLTVDTRDGSPGCDHYETCAPVGFVRVTSIRRSAGAIDGLMRVEQDIPVIKRDAWTLVMELYA